MSNYCPSVTYDALTEGSDINKGEAGRSVNNYLPIEHAKPQQISTGYKGNFPSTINCTLNTTSRALHQSSDFNKLQTGYGIVSNLQMDPNFTNQMLASTSKDSQYFANSNITETFGPDRPSATENVELGNTTNIMQAKQHCKNSQIGLIPISSCEYRNIPNNMVLQNAGTEGSLPYQPMIASDIFNHEHTTVNNTSTSQNIKRSSTTADLQRNNFSELTIRRVSPMKGKLYETNKDHRKNNIIIDKYGMSSFSHTVQEHSQNNVVSRKSMELNSSMSCSTKKTPLFRPYDLQNLKFQSTSKNTILESQRQSALINNIKANQDSNVANNCIEYYSSSNNKSSEEFGNHSSMASAHEDPYNTLRYSKETDNTANKMQDSTAKISEDFEKSKYSPVTIDDGSSDLVAEIKIEEEFFDADDNRKPLSYKEQSFDLQEQKFWILMVRRDVLKVHKFKKYWKKKVFANMREIAEGCLHYSQLKALQSQKIIQDKGPFMKKLTFAMKTYWLKVALTSEDSIRNSESEVDEQITTRKKILESKRKSEVASSMEENIFIHSEIKIEEEFLGADDHEPLSRNFESNRHIRKLCSESSNPRKRAKINNATDKEVCKDFAIVDKEPSVCDDVPHCSSDVKDKLLLKECQTKLKCVSQKQIQPVKTVLSRTKETPTSRAFPLRSLRNHPKVNYDIDNYFLKHLTDEDDNSPPNSVGSPSCSDHSTETEVADDFNCRNLVSNSVKAASSFDSSTDSELMDDDSTRNVEVTCSQENERVECPPEKWKLWQNELMRWMKEQKSQGIDVPITIFKERALHYCIVYQMPLPHDQHIKDFRNKYKGRITYNKLIKEATCSQEDERVECPPEKWKLWLNELIKWMKEQKRQGIHVPVNIFKERALHYCIVYQMPLPHEQHIKDFLQMYQSKISYNKLIKRKLISEAKSSLVTVGGALVKESVNVEDILDLSSRDVRQNLNVIQDKVSLMKKLSGEMNRKWKSVNVQKRPKIMAKRDSKERETQQILKSLGSSRNETGSFKSLNGKNLRKPQNRRYVSHQDSWDDSSSDDNDTNCQAQLLLQEYPTAHSKIILKKVSVRLTRLEDCPLGSLDLRKYTNQEVSKFSFGVDNSNNTDDQRFEDNPSSSIQNFLNLSVRLKRLTDSFTRDTNLRKNTKRSLATIQESSEDSCGIGTRQKRLKYISNRKNSLRKNTSRILDTDEESFDDSCGIGARGNRLKYRSNRKNSLRKNARTILDANKQSSDDSCGIESDLSDNGHSESEQLLDSAQPRKAATKIPLEPLEISSEETLNGFINIHKDSLQLVGAPSDVLILEADDIDPSSVFNVAFTFDCEVQCSITLMYFCFEEETESGIISYIPQNLSASSWTYSYESGANQKFCHACHIFNPSKYPEDSLLYSSNKGILPIVISCVANVKNDSLLSHVTSAVFEKHSEEFLLKLFYKKYFTNGSCTLSYYAFNDGVKDAKIIKKNISPSKRKKSNRNKQVDYKEPLDTFNADFSKNIDASIISSKRSIRNRKKINYSINEDDMEVPYNEEEASSDSTFRSTSGEYDLSESDLSDEAYSESEVLDDTALSRKVTSKIINAQVASVATPKEFINIQIESLQFIRAPVDVLNIEESGEERSSSLFNIEFTFHCQVRCFITIMYFCIEEKTDVGVIYIPQNSTNDSGTYEYESGSNQCFYHAEHVIDPSKCPDAMLLYTEDKKILPVVISCFAAGNGGLAQFHVTAAMISKDTKGYTLKPFIQKDFAKGICFHIYKISDGRWKYTCEICGKSFEKKGSLHGHKSVHSLLKIPAKVASVATPKEFINIQIESLRFVRAPVDVLNIEESGEERSSSLFNIEFTFHCQVRCSITIMYFCIEEKTNAGVLYIPQNSTNDSETYDYESGSNQCFYHAGHVIDLSKYPDDMLLYTEDKKILPVVISCFAAGNGGSSQFHVIAAMIKKDSKGYTLEPFIEKDFVNGICFRSNGISNGIRKLTSMYRPKFVCDICGNSYSLKSSLEKHSRMHSSFKKNTEVASKTASSAFIGINLKSFKFVKAPVDVVMLEESASRRFPTLLNIEFTFDCKVQCAIKLMYFCVEDNTNDGVLHYIPKDSSSSSCTYVYESGPNQKFYHADHFFDPSKILENNLLFSSNIKSWPIVISCIATDSFQALVITAGIEKHCEGYTLVPLTAKYFNNGICFARCDIFSNSREFTTKTKFVCKTCRRVFSKQIYLDTHRKLHPPMMLTSQITAELTAPKAFININLESLKFIKAPDDVIILDESTDSSTDSNHSSTKFNIEFTFDCRVCCSIDIQYFCIEEQTDSGVIYIPHDLKSNSLTYNYGIGNNQKFYHASHIVYPSKYLEDSLLYASNKKIIPVVINCCSLGEKGSGLSQVTLAGVAKRSDEFILEPFKQKYFMKGVCKLSNDIANDGSSEIYTIVKAQSPVISNATFLSGSRSLRSRQKVNYKLNNDKEGDPLSIASDDDDPLFVEDGVKLTSESSTDSYSELEDASGPPRAVSYQKNKPCHSAWVSTQLRKVYSVPSDIPMCPIELSLPSGQNIYGITSLPGASRLNYGNAEKGGSITQQIESMQFNVDLQIPHSFHEETTILESPLSSNAKVSEVQSTESLSKSVDNSSLSETIVRADSDENQTAKNSTNILVESLMLLEPDHSINGANKDQTHNSSELLEMANIAEPILLSTESDSVLKQASSELQKNKAESYQILTNSSLISNVENQFNEAVVLESEKSENEPCSSLIQNFSEPMKIPLTPEDTQFNTELGKSNAAIECLDSVELCETRMTLSEFIQTKKDHEQLKLVERLCKIPNTFKLIETNKSSELNEGNSQNSSELKVVPDKTTSRDGNNTSKNREFPLLSKHNEAFNSSSDNIDAQSDKMLETVKRNVSSACETKPGEFQLKVKTLHDQNVIPIIEAFVPASDLNHAKEVSEQLRTPEQIEILESMGSSNLCALAQTSIVASNLIAESEKDVSESNTNKGTSASVMTESSCNNANAPKQTKKILDPNQNTKSNEPSSYAGVNESCEELPNLNTLIHINSNSLSLVEVVVDPGKCSDESNLTPCPRFNIEFTFDCMVAMDISIVYLPVYSEDMTNASLSNASVAHSKEAVMYHYKKGSSQRFSQPVHVFDPSNYVNECHPTGSNYFHVEICCSTEKGKDPYQRHITNAIIEKLSDGFKIFSTWQKLFTNGNWYLFNASKQCNLMTLTKQLRRRQESNERSKASAKRRLNEDPEMQKIALKKFRNKTVSEFNEKPFKCSKCNFAGTRKSDLTAHYGSQHDARPFKCSRCEFSCGTKSKLLNHIYTTHKKNFEQLSCSKCDFTCHSSDNLNNHILSVHESEVLKCSQCEHTCGNTNQLMQHVFSVHEKINCLKCPHCDFTCSMQYQLKEHKISVHHKGKVKNCPQCQFTSFTNDGLYTHILLVHEKNRSFKCSQCSYACNSNSELRKHKKNMHSKEKSFPCSNCEFVATSSYTLGKHRTSVHLKLDPFKCSRCDFFTLIKSQLKNHILQVHENFRPYKCSQCDFSNKNKLSLKDHVAAVHDRVKDIKCPHCDYKCTTKTLLQAHTKAIHEKLKPFKCTQCDYACSRNNYLTMHVKAVHDKLRPFKCPHCEHACSRNDNLLVHIKKVHK